MPSVDAARDLCVAALVGYVDGSAVGAGREAGCTAFFLTATELGYPVYVKMGFVPICTMRTYTAP